MEKIVKNCGECPLKFWDLYLRCNHPQKDYYGSLNPNELHPSCPEGQPFVIKTSKTKEDE